MYNVNWDLLIQHLLPWMKRKQRFKDWLHVLFYPLRGLHSQFLTYMDDTFYRLAITSQIIYLEKLLNDKFNAGGAARSASSQTGLYDGAPTGIYISYPNGVIFPLYVWNEIEQRPKVFLYNKWRNTVTYFKGDRVVYGTMVYRALLNNINNTPDAINSKWVQDKERTFLRNKLEIDGEYDFVVNIPIACGDVNNVLFAAQVTAQLNVYVIAGRRFQLVNY